MTERQRPLGDRLPADVVAVGETMVMLTPSAGGSLEEAQQLTVLVGGAESNVAIHLARLDVRARWVSRVGDDPLGRRIVREVAAAGVDTNGVIVDQVAPTGLFLKDPDPVSSRVHYYRRGSAASRMEPTLLDAPALANARVLHLTGITAALSSSCAALVRSAVLDRRAPCELLSFDVNHRPGLWSAAEAAPVLAELADASDLVFVGLDEAERLWGTGSPSAVRDRLPSPTTIVVKDGAVAAHVLTHEAMVSVPSLPVDVVEPVGAGDAFAAGYLAGLLEGADATTSLRFGHLVASQVLQARSDVVELPARGWFEHLLALSDDDWPHAEVARDVP